MKSTCESLQPSWMAAIALAVVGCGSGLNYHHEAPYADLAIATVRRGDISGEWIATSNVHPTAAFLQVVRSDGGSLFDRQYLAGSFRGALTLPLGGRTFERSPDSTTSFLCGGYHFPCSDWALTLDEVLPALGALTVRDLVADVSGLHLLLRDEARGIDWLAKVSSGGMRSWEKQLSAPVDGLAVADGGVVTVGSTASALTVTRFGPTGAILWTRSFPGTRASETPAVAVVGRSGAHGLLVAADGWAQVEVDGEPITHKPGWGLAALLDHDGAVVWARSVISATDAPPVFAPDGSVYLLGGLLQKVGPGGDPRWSVPGAPFSDEKSSSLALSLDGLPLVAGKFVEYTPNGHVRKTALTTFTADAGVAIHGPRLEGGLAGHRGLAIDQRGDLTLALVREY